MCSFNLFPSYEFRENDIVCLLYDLIGYLQPMKIGLPTIRITIKFPSWKDKTKWQKQKLQLKDEVSIANVPLEMVKNILLAYGEGLFK